MSSILSEPEDGGFEPLEEKGDTQPAPMTDASKRCMVAPPEHEVVMSGPNESKKVESSPHSFGLTLPKGVTDFGEWGCTVLEVGKYRKMGYSYQEMASSTSSHIKPIVTGCCRKISPGFDLFYEGFRAIPDGA